MLILLTHHRVVLHNLVRTPRDFSRATTLKQFHAAIRMASSWSVRDEAILREARKIVPTFAGNANHKGQHGRIGIIGGCEEYTGAPYFAGISALRVGADLVHIFCTKSAAVAIKSYSPDLIVHPILDQETAVEEISRWAERLHVMVIGPGLGQSTTVSANVRALLQTQALSHLKLVIDADGLRFWDDLVANPDLSGIFTPNDIEYRRNGDRIATYWRSGSSNFIVLKKGARDVIHTSGTETHQTGDFVGSGRRCGGQGDLLSGAIATMYHWAVTATVGSPGVIACQAASLLIKRANFAAFAEKGRGTLCADIVEKIPIVFKAHFEETE